MDWWDARPVSACGNGWGNRMGELFLWALGLNDEWRVGPKWRSPRLLWDDRVGMGTWEWMDGRQGVKGGVVDWGYRCIGGQDIEVPGAWVHPSGPRMSWVGYVPGRSDGTRPLLQKLQVELLRSFLLGQRQAADRLWQLWFFLFFWCV